MIQFNKETVELLLKQQMLVSELSRLQGYEWEYGHPAIGDVYGRMSDEENVKFVALLDAYGIDKEAIVPYIPDVAAPDDDEEEEEEVNKDSIVEEEVEVETNTEDLEVV